MRKSKWYLPLLCATTLLAQDQPITANPPVPSSPAPVNSPTDQPSNPAPEAPPQTERDVSVNPKKFARNFFSDQKMIWTFPAKVGTGHHLVPVLAILGGTAAMVAAADPPVARYFRRNGSTFAPIDDTLSEHRTTAATLLAPAGLYVGGLIAKDSYLAHTGLLAAEAWVDVDILGEVMRNIARRRRPLDIAPDGNFQNTWFKTGGNPLNSSGSFPSGHTAWGFAVATVVARRYPQHKWVTVLAYGLAALDGFTRVSSSNHFLSDTVFGAVLGYATGRFVVLRQ